MNSKLILFIFFVIDTCNVTAQVCDPICENDGVCQEGNACLCKEGGGYTGDRCEIRK